MSITLEENLSVNPRSTILYFSLPQVPEYGLLELLITQQGNDSEMSIDRTDIWYMAQGDTDDFTQVINIKTSGNWKLYTEQDNAEYAYDSWVTSITESGSGSGEISITVAPWDDNSDVSRSTYIYIGLDEQDFEPRQIKVSQFGRYQHHISSQDLISDGGNIYLDSSGSAQEFAIITSHPWVIAAADDTGVAGHMSWVTPTPTTGVNGDKISVSCTENKSLTTRTTQFYIGLVVEGNTYYYSSFVVNQAGIDATLSFSDPNVEFESSGGSKNIQVTSSAAWKIRYDSPYLNDNATWFSASMEHSEQGESGDVITFSALENTSITSRSTEIYFVMDEYSDMDPVVYTVSQKGTAIENAAFSTSLTADSLRFIAESSSSLSANLDITSELPWRVMSSADGDNVIYDHRAWVSVISTTQEGDATIQVSITNNQFNTPRSTTINLYQDESGKRISIPVSQEANASSNISTYGNLGKGYNSAGVYADQAEIRNQVVDCDKLEALKLIEEINYESYTSDITKTYETIEDLQESFTISAGVAGSYNGFSGEVTSKYGSSLKEYAETRYGSRTITYRKATVCASNVSLEELKSCVLEDVRGYINDASIPASTIISTYGTHVLLGYVLGGKLEYCSSAVRSSTEGTDNFEATIKAAYTTGVNNISTEATGTYDTAIKSSSYDCEETTTTRGGAAYSNADAWTASLSDFSTLAMIDFAGDGVTYDIWQLADDPDRQKALREAADAATSTLVSGTQQCLYQFQFWLGSVQYNGTDSGSDSEFKIDMNTKYVRTAGDNHSNYAWTDMWNPYLESMGDDGGVNYFDVGTEASEGTTNRFTTSELYIGGSSQVELGISFNIFESDSGENATSGDDEATCYHFFRSKQNYNRATDTSDPFYYITTENLAETNYPFANVDAGYIGYTPTWWTRPLSWLRGTTYYNGTVGYASANGKWTWFIYYRDVNAYSGDYAN